MANSIKDINNWHTTPYEGITEKAVVMTAWVYVKMIIEHELIEGFEYHEVKLFNLINHYSIFCFQKIYLELKNPTCFNRGRMSTKNR